MTEPQTTRREAADPFGEWAGSKGVLMSYAYLASAPRAVDRTHAENLLHIRRDLRTPAGAMLAAPLAIAMLDAAGVNVDPINILALTQVNITVIEHGRDVDDVFVAGRVATEARSQIFTEASFYDAGDREKLIGLGSANWSVICPTPDGFVYPEPGEGVDDTSDVPPLWQAYTGRKRADGRLEIPGLRPRDRRRAASPWTDARGGRGGRARCGCRGARYRRIVRRPARYDDRGARSSGAVCRGARVSRGEWGRGGVPRRTA